ncbi:CDP-diacylglycerol diphosphatase [Asaia prunellae]|uniref:CDP-diacylglycerol diphosphatase n=1 Tax=Asaia prunellae TaxID=610245 RepID=UPI000686D82B|nr:CDP-diacylglycerol diphosphatase [Asaia prunellae]
MLTRWKWAALAAVMAGALSHAQAGTVIHKDHDPDILWKIVHQKCAQGTRPCTVYDSTHRIALLHSIEGRGQYLLIPTDKLAGMESPALLVPGQPNYFAEAWKYRDRVAASYGTPIPEKMLSLAINSSKGRSQNQLHIHLDCLAPHVREILDRYNSRIGPSWSVLPETIEGHHYRALYLATLNASPFLVLASSLADPESEMGNHTLVLAPLGSGYALLDDRAQDVDRASGEELQDHACHAVKSDVSFEAKDKAAK